MHEGNHIKSCYLLLFLLGCVYGLGGGGLSFAFAQSSNRIPIISYHQINLI